MVQRGADYKRRERDLYPTPDGPVQVLLEHFYFSGNIIDPCAGNGSLLRAVRARGYTVLGSDIRLQTRMGGLIRSADFLSDKYPYPDHRGDIITNPPYGSKGALAVAFIEKALTLPCQKVAMLLPVDFDSAKTRQHIFGECETYSAKLILLDRIVWFERDDGEKEAPATNHAWYIWDKKNDKAYPTIHYGGWK